MNRKSMLTTGSATVWLAVLGGLAISAQDSAPSKYSVKVPGGLALSEFKGYEGWQVISMSRNEKLVAVTVGNPAMIDAHAAGIPENGNTSQTEPRWRRFTGARKRTSSFLR